MSSCVLLMEVDELLHRRRILDVIQTLLSFNVRCLQIRCVFLRRDTVLLIVCFASSPTSTVGHFHQFRVLADDEALVVSPTAVRLHGNNIIIRGVGFSMELNVFETNADNYGFELPHAAYGVLSFLFIDQNSNHV